MATKKQKKAAETTIEKPEKKRISITLYQEDLDVLEKASEDSYWRVNDFIRHGARLMAVAQGHLNRHRAYPVPCKKCGSTDIAYMGTAKEENEEKAETKVVQGFLVRTGKKEKKEKKKEPHFTSMKCRNCGERYGRTFEEICMEEEVVKWFWGDYLGTLSRYMTTEAWNEHNISGRKRKK